MQNSMLMFTNTFWGNFGCKIKIVSFRWNFISRLIRMCKIQWCCSLLSFLTGNNLFWANLAQKVKIVSLRWNLILTLIRICRIQWWCLLFSFLIGNTLFGNFGPKNKYCQLKAKLGPYTYSNTHNSMMLFTFFVFNRNTLFGQIWSKKLKLLV